MRVMSVDRFWDGLEMDLDSLPTHLYRQSRLLRQNLGIRYSPTGAFRDILGTPDANPSLQQPLWMLDDLGVSIDSSRRVFEEHAFRAAFYAFALVHLDEEIRLGEPGIEFSALHDWLVRQNSAELASVLPGEPDFWPRHRRTWESYGEANLALDDPVYGSTDDELVGIQTARSGPLALAPLAAAVWAGRLKDLDEVETLLRHLGFVEVVRADLAAMMRHLARSWVSPTVRRMVSPLGIDLREVPGAEVMLGEIVLNRAMDPMMEDCLSHLDEAQGLADELQLPTFQSYCRLLAATLSKSPVQSRPPKSASQSARPRLQTPVQMAARFLLADPTFREAWEVHRWGLLGAVEISARFPAGLILEILALHGVEVTEMVDDFFWSIDEQHLAYYDHPAARPYVESDTLGLLLRLYTHSSQTKRHRTVLNDYLALLGKHARPDGFLPVWLVDSDNATALILGEGCGTIEANLVRGLLGYKPDEHMSLIMPSARRLLGDYAARGSSVNVNYPQPYTRAVLAEFMDQLDKLGLSKDIPELAPARERLRTEVARATQQARITPQEAACLIWSCSRPGLADLETESWQAIVTSGQSFDGGWAGEPFFFAPSPGGQTRWYASRLLTTALCFHALLIPTRAVRQLPDRLRTPPPTL